MLISLNQVPEADVARNKTLFGASEILSRFKVFWFTIGDRHDPEPRVAKSSGCNNRSKDDHSFLKSQDFFVWRFFRLVSFVA